MAKKTKAALGAALLRRWKAGESPTAMARERGCHVNTIRRLMEKAAGGPAPFKVLIKRRRASV